MLQLPRPQDVPLSAAEGWSVHSLHPAMRVGLAWLLATATVSGMVLSVTPEIGLAKGKIGELTQFKTNTKVAGCVSDTGSSGHCADGVGLDGAFALALSPNNKWLYTVSRSANAVVLVLPIN